MKNRDVLYATCFCFRVPALLCSPFPNLLQNEKLEKEKLEQLALLRDLEEQKAKLEQMLLESQQENNQLKMVVTHEEHQASIISDHGGGSAETTQVCCLIILSGVILF